MDVKQVFREYEGPVSDNPMAFCMSCGSPCADVASNDGRFYRTCTGCGRVHFRNPSPTVAVLVVQDECLLLCLREDRMFRGGKWCLPGGYMDFGEDFLTAGRREVWEETGLEVQIKAILSVASNNYTPEMSSVCVIMLAGPIGGKMEARDETQDVRWHPFGQELPPMAFEHHEHIVQRYLATGLEGAPVDPEYAQRQLSLDKAPHS